MIDLHIKLIILMCSPSGSGKTFLANQIKDFANKSGVFRDIRILSTDEFFTLNPEKQYRFDATQLGKAHRWNIDRFNQACKEGADLIIIDNTNLSLSDMRPYVKESCRYGYITQVLTPSTGWKENIEELLLKNQHSVPRETIEKQLQRYKSVMEKINNGEFEKLCNECRLECCLEFAGEERATEIFQKIYPSVSTLIPKA